MAVQHIFQLRTFSLLNLFEKHRQLYIFFHRGDVISLDVLLLFQRTHSCYCCTYIMQCSEIWFEALTEV